MTVFDHPIIKYITPFMHIADGDRGNVDVLQPPDRLRELALGVVVNCAACAAVIHPFRVRAKSERSRVAGQPEERRLFYSGTCSSEQNPGCARTVAAREHKTFVERWFAERKSP